MQNWMQALAGHYERIAAAYPDDDLLILFDIDGTILDTRYLMLYLLRAYDQHHGTQFFINRQINDIRFSARELEAGLLDFGVDDRHIKAIRHWYDSHCWSMSAILESHRPFPGVLDVIRWFQLQPRTHVGLNTARPESLRGETLCSLNRLGHEYRVQFSSELMFMRNEYGTESVTRAKVAGLEYFQTAGYRVFAMVDNQPDILAAVAATDPDAEILLLHAGTLFQQRPERIPATAVHGNVYDLTELIPKKALPRHTQLVWRGVSSEVTLKQFLDSNVHWADLSVMANPCSAVVHVSGEADATRERQSQLLRECLVELRQHRRGVKVDLKSDRDSNRHLISLLQQAGISSDELWFHAEVEHLGEVACRRLAETHPGAVIEVAVDFLAPLILNGGALAEAVLDRLNDWGVNRFALNWSTPRVRLIQQHMDHWGFETTIYDVRDLESFLQAVLLTPHAICSDLNFPKWQDRPAGKRQVHTLDEETALKRA